ncbi:acetyl-CoA C-acyltransferase [Shouchella lonarensis]|uniref:acetyl-CoA C-acetyltransferase n=1 Tax=Shouchella lonarensis TaxID=1464122 RepID=A0A1G6H951_9BACI|nr:acetyl-CoA C-acyltransferase [Shouchella lonarensis]SDB90782.1 3-oxo-5,6-didehydrosuberyl-CoA/3-oxoadipyl-CoA thiolase [Shouchella lonarensis]
MREVVIVDAVRTPIGRYKGALKYVRPDDLAAQVIAALMERNESVPADEVEEVILGNANQAGEDNRNVARMAALLAGLPVSVGGSTINRLCGSGLDAVIYAARALACGEADVMIAGGVESMTRAPYVLGKPEIAFSRGEMTLQDTTIGWRFTNERLAAMYGADSMAQTAENVASRYKISRAEQDQFAAQSQARTKQTMAQQTFAREMVPVVAKDPKGNVETVTVDEHPRPETTVETLARLRPIFPGGTITAGNASGINDGASALLLMTADKAAALGMKPIARFVASAVAGVAPRFMGIGPIEATQKALKRANLTIAQLDVIELNEAFAAQALACIRSLGLDETRVNVNGGAIALGHPLGASGARILTTLVHELERRDAQYGLATMCIGVGQGIAVIVERMK